MINEIFVEVPQDYHFSSPSHSRLWRTENRPIAAKRHTTNDFSSGYKTTENKKPTLFHTSHLRKFERCHSHSQ